MTSSLPTAALTLSLTGPFKRQGAQAAEGARLWAKSSSVPLTLVDDGGSRATAIEAYAGWLDSVDLLLGPYSSGLVRAVAPLVRGAGRLLWNHGGSADDLAQPSVACLPAPASSYFSGAVDEAVACGVTRLVVARGSGPHAQTVADGAAARANERGINVRVVDISAVDGQDLTDAALLLAGRFEDDVAAVRRLGDQRRSLLLLGAVAAGIHPFHEELGGAAEGVLGPVHWWPSPRTPQIGPSGVDFAARYHSRTGREPSYVAALAAAAGYLANAAYHLGLAAEDVPKWETSTLLGDFALDAAWRQVGLRVTTIRWKGGRMVPIGAI
ncbi:MAG: ABC transporter substrate-binding protein [Egibacteraceae bacterium]